MINEGDTFVIRDNVPTPNEKGFGLPLYRGGIKSSVADHKVIR